MNEYDVLIIGAGTTGTYFSYLMAKEGYKVLVIEKEKEENIRKNLDIIHFPYDGFEEVGLPTSKKGDPEYEKEFFETYNRSALNNYEKHNKNHVAVLHLPLLIKKIRTMAIKAGAKFVFETEFKHIMYDDSHTIKGVVVKQGSKEKEIDATVVVDASGINSVVRRDLNDPYIETFEIGPKDRFFVLLKYVTFKDPKDGAKLSCSWPYYKCWVAPQMDNKGAIIGCGQSTSIDYARKGMDKFLKRIPLPEWTLDHEEMGSTPYCRPPYSFVTDHFIALGDAIALTHPMSGEGIYLTFKMEHIASVVLTEALKRNDLTVSSLWRINYVYQRDEGKDFAFLRAGMVGAMNMSEKDNDFLFSKGIIFKDDNEKEPDIPKALTSGVFHKMISLKSVNNLLVAFARGNALKNHYSNYPETPDDYKAWKDKADRLWERAGKISDLDKDE